MPCLFQTFHLLPSSCAKQTSLACTVISTPVKKLVWVSCVMARAGTTILLFCCAVEHIYFCSSENIVNKKYGWQDTHEYRNGATREVLTMTQFWKKIKTLRMLLTALWRPARKLPPLLQDGGSCAFYSSTWFFSCGAQWLARDDWYSWYSS